MMMSRPAMVTATNTGKRMIQFFASSAGDVIATTPANPVSAALHYSLLIRSPTSSGEASATMIGLR